MTSRAHAHVAGIQRHLEAIYGLDRQEARAERFLIGDDELDALVRRGTIPADASRPDEQLLVLPGDDGSSVALYLSDRVQRGLEQGPSLQDHCHATEGVSHLLLLAWSGSEDRRVRPIELELQAEVDKVGTSLLLLRSQGRRDATSQLRRLFVGAVMRRDLTADERARYRTAHRLGAEYARRLTSLLDRGVEELLLELRRFYRLSGDAKLHRAAA